MDPKLGFQSNDDGATTAERKRREAAAVLGNRGGWSGDQRRRRKKRGRAGEVNAQDPAMAVVLAVTAVGGEGREAAGDVEEKGRWRRSAAILVEEKGSTEARKAGGRRREQRLSRVASGEIVEEVEYEAGGELRRRRNRERRRWQRGRRNRVMGDDFPNSGDGKAERKKPWKRKTWLRRREEKGRKRSAAVAGDGFRQVELPRLAITRRDGEGGTVEEEGEGRQFSDHGRLRLLGRWLSKLRQRSYRSGQIKSNRRGGRGRRRKRIKLSSAGWLKDFCRQKKISNFLIQSHY